MALVLILVILLIWIGVIGSLYSSIIPFVYTLGNASNYTIAYYGAQMSVERWLLALRYHDAWFEWMSGILSGNISDSWSLTNLWRITSDPTSNAYWKITSRVTSIPSSGDGNIEALLATGDSSQYNSLTYNEWLELPLYLDTPAWPAEYYTTPSSLQPLSSSPYSIQGRFRLPPKVKGTLGNIWLDENADIDEDQINDDVIVTRWYKWLNTLDSNTFSIAPTLKQDFNSNSPLYAYDNAIRESTLNAGEIDDNIDSSINWFNITKGTSSVSWHNILPLGSAWEAIDFGNIFSDTSLLGAFTFSISNRMQNADGDFYPFLEWQLKACDITSCDIIMPDRYYSLEWVGKVWDYTVRMDIKKPVRKTTNGWSFTIIF
jgi:hypothetical protein